MLLHNQQGTTTAKGLRDVSFGGRTLLVVLAIPTKKSLTPCANSRAITVTKQRLQRKGPSKTRREGGGGASLSLAQLLGGHVFRAKLLNTSHHTLAISETHKVEGLALDGDTEQPMTQTTTNRG